MNLPTCWKEPHVLAKQGYSRGMGDVLLDLTSSSPRLLVGNISPEQPAFSASQWLSQDDGPEFSIPVPAPTCSGPGHTVIRPSVRMLSQSKRESNPSYRFHLISGVECLLGIRQLRGTFFLPGIFSLFPPFQPRAGSPELGQLLGL